MPFAAIWMELEIVILSEVSQTKKEKYHIPYMQNLKRNETNELIFRIETNLQTQRMNLWLPGGRMRGRDREFGINMYTLLYFKWIYVQHRQFFSKLCGRLDVSRVWRRRDTCMWMAESLCCPLETITTLLLGYTSIQNKKLKKKKKLPCP